MSIPLPPVKPPLNYAYRFLITVTVVTFKVVLDVLFEKYTYYRVSQKCTHSGVGPRIEEMFGDAEVYFQ
jgi:hypothetical protein